MAELVVVAPEPVPAGLLVDGGQSCALITTEVRGLNGSAIAVERHVPEHHRAGPVAGGCDFELCRWAWRDARGAFAHDLG